MADRTCDNIATELEFASGLPVQNGNEVEMPKHIDIGECEKEQLGAIERECSRRMLTKNTFFTGRVHITDNVPKIAVPLVTAPNGYVLVTANGGACND